MARSFSLCFLSHIPSASPAFYIPKSGTWEEEVRAETIQMQVVSELGQKNKGQVAEMNLWVQFCTNTSDMFRLKYLPMWWVLQWWHLYLKKWIRTIAQQKAEVDTALSQSLIYECTWSPHAEKVASCHLWSGTGCSCVEANVCAKHLGEGRDRLQCYVALQTSVQAVSNPKRFC